MEYLGWLYLATRLDAIQAWFTWLTGISVIMAIAAGFVILLSYDMTYEAKTPENIARKEAFRTKVRPWRNWGIGLFLVFGMMLTLTPSKKDAMIIAGGVGVIEASKAIAGSEIAQTSVKIIEKWLQDQLGAPAKPAAPEKKAEPKTEPKSHSGGKVKDVISGAVDGAVDGALKGIKK